MAYDTVIQQGYFTSDQTDKIIPLRSDVDWVEVINLTKIAATAQWDGCVWYWQRGMAQDDSVLSFHGAANQIISMSTSAIGYNGATYRGISLINSSEYPLGAEIATTAGTNAVRPLYSTGDTGTLIEGNIVRINSTDHDNINGMDFTVDTITADTSFRLANILSHAPGVIAGTGFWRYVAPSVAVYDMFKPKNRVISEITSASPGVVTTLVDHGYATGDKLKFKVPADCGMVELDGQIITVTRVDAASFSIGVDTTGYTNFTYPLAAVGDESQYAQTLPLGGATTPFQDGKFIGIVLGTSDTAGIAAGSPGGVAGDAIKWRAGKSFANIVG